MSWQRIRAIIGKDIRELTANRMVVIPMVIVPLVLCIVLPTALLLAALLAGNTAFVQGAQQIEKLIPFYHVPAVFTNVVQRLMYIFLNYTFIPLFMVVPLMVSTIVAANSVVGEKERKTLETLLYTPVTNREFVIAKLLASFIPAFVISVVAFALYFIATNLVSVLVAGRLIVRSWIWLPALLVLSPAISIVGLSTTLLVSLKAKSFQEAQQIAGVVVLPLVALVLVQVTGVVIFNVLYLIVFGIVLLGVGALLVMRVLPRFTRESIINTL